MQEIFILKPKNLYLLINVLFLFIVIEPAYLGRIEILNGVNRILKLTVGIFILLYYIVISIKKITIKGKMDSYILCIAGFEFLLLFSTIINAGSIAAWFMKCAYVMILAIYMQIMLTNDPYALVKALSIVLGMYVHINLLTRFLYPAGLYISDLEGYKNCWFLGYDNLSAIIIILSQIVAVFRIMKNKNKVMIWDKTVVISGIVFIFMQQIATGILAEIIFFGFILLMKISSVPGIIKKAKIIIIEMYVLFFLLQFFNLQQRGLFVLIFSILGKDTTLTGRALLWQKAWRDIFTDWSFWGFGIQNASSYVSRFGNVATTHFHCNYLQVFYEGGIIGEILLFLMLYYPAWNYDRSLHDNCSMVFLSGLASILLIWQVEAYTTVTTYFIIALTLLNYCNKFKPLINGS